MATRPQRQEDAPRDPRPRDDQRPQRDVTDRPVIDPVTGVVPPEPNMPDEAGDVDYTHGDATRVRESPRGSATPEAQRDAEEARRRARYREGATEVSHQE